MAVANVGSKWVDGNLIFFSKLDGQVLLIINAASKEITVPSGAGFDAEDGAIAVTKPDEKSIDVVGDKLTVLVDDATIEIDDTAGLQTKGVSGSFKDYNEKIVVVTNGIITDLDGE